MSNNSEVPEKFNSLVLALAYLKRHPTRYLFPIRKDAKFPPLLKDNLDSNCSNSPDQIKKWSRQFVGCNWGVAHKKSRLLVVDVDVNPAKRKQGQVTFDALELMYGFDDTEKTTTPSGGFHLVYEGPHITAFGKNGLGLDIDSPNYTLIPGCQFADGTSYVGDGAPAVACPEWIYSVIKNSKASARITNASEVVVDQDKPENVTWAIDFLKEDAEPAIEGRGGDFTTYKTACWLKDHGISPTLAVELMLEHYNPRCEPEWDREGIERKVASGYTYSNLAKAGGKTAEADFADDPPEMDFSRLPMGNPEKIKAAAAERAEVREREASRPANVGARKYTRDELSERWVYVDGLERFVCRDDPPPRKRGDDWDPDVNERPIYSAPKFDKAFRYLATAKKKSISDTLLAAKKGSIMHFANMVYRPGKDEFAGENYNVYRGSGIVLTPAATDEAKADLKFWNDHLDYLFAGDKASRDHLVNFFAWRIQYPGKKMKHALIFQGEHKGTGKSFTGRMLADILGALNVAYPREADLSNKFNAWAAAAQMIIVEELRAVEKHKIKANLHPMITEEIIPVEFKGVDAKKFYNCFGILAFTNWDAALSIDPGDRRYLVIRTKAIPRDKPYYKKLFDILERPDSVAAIGWELQQRDLKEYSAAASAPETAAKADMIAAGGPPLEQWMTENAHMWPLCARLTTVEEIAVIVPRVLADKYVYQNIATALKAAFNGVSIRIPVNGVKTSLWAINAEVEVNDELRKRARASAAGDKKMVTSCNMWLAATYVADKVKARRAAGEPLEPDLAGEDGTEAVDEFADIM